jgi:hypothetical protein
VMRIGYCRYNNLAAQCPRQTSPNRHCASSHAT